MKLGKLTFSPINEHTELLAPATAERAQELSDSIWVTPIDATLADTAAFCEAYDVGLDISANCVIVEAKRGERIWYAACIILATDKVDVNGTVRKHLDARKLSFAPMDTAVALTGMEYGGITPLGLPADWPILIDSAVMEHEKVIIGSGIRASKILIPSPALASLLNATVLDIKKPSN
jgi:prolyl-tRNA editing enzyme YbaK/EbsC (Cys-tRNA(Pro) deacylase)